MTKAKKPQPVDPRAGLPKLNRKLIARQWWRFKREVSPPEWAQEFPTVRAIFYAGACAATDAMLRSVDRGDGEQMGAIADECEAFRDSLKPKAKRK